MKERLIVFWQLIMLFIELLCFGISRCSAVSVIRIIFGTIITVKQNPHLIHVQIRWFRDRTPPVSLPLHVLLLRAPSPVEEGRLQLDKRREGWGGAGATETVRLCWIGSRDQYFNLYKSNFTITFTSPGGCLQFERLSQDYEQSKSVSGAARVTPISDSKDKALTLF